jgi:hypothetical protein
MITRALYRVGFRDWMGHGASLGSVGLCIALWIRAKTVDQDERGNAERRALFVGLWAPTLWSIGDSLSGQEPRRRLLRRS